MNTDIDKLDDIERLLKRIEVSKEAHNYAGGAVALVNTLPPWSKVWRDRTKVFTRMASYLHRMTRTVQTDEVLSRARFLHNKVVETEQLLNVVINDEDLPPIEADRAIRYVADDERLKSSPLIQNALAALAIHCDDFEVRRSAWLQLCRQHAQNPPLSNSDGGGHGKFGGQNLKRIRKEFIRGRETLGSRGTITDATEVADEAEALVTDLLSALTKPVDVERKEAALTLGEIGGTEEAILLADALRSEIEERSVDEDYQVYLASALSNIGGPDAVDGLLRAAEKGPERVRLAALSGLESLATAGSVALTEYPEPATIYSEEMRDAYIRLAERLSTLISASSTPPYVRHKARELLDTVRISLKST
jgi:hypothetical protein